MGHVRGRGIDRFRRGVHGGPSDSLDVEICCDSDAGSVADLEWKTWDDACFQTFWGEGGAFPPKAAVIQPAVVFRDIVFCEEECDIAVTDRRIAMIPPVTTC